MRTTVILEDEVYEKLVQQAVRRYGTAKSLSKLLNVLLRQSMQQDEKIPESMFGAWKNEKPMDLSDLREEGEPH
ncbi:hypothetical protein HYV43_05735 [Candidatus Micrarchaeota archaeon]|nr:hypothetical protein [Candidatus Micrarchaeota archaeon]